MEIDPKLLKKAQDGDPDAQHHLGLLYSMDFLGEDVDAAKAAFWLKEAAKNGHPSARLELQIQMGKVSRSKGIQRRVDKSLEGHDRGGMKHRILVIDDDDSIFDALTLHIKDHPIKLLYAGNGLDGLAILQKEGFVDLILLDYKLPKGNGLQVLNSIRQMDGGENQQVIMMSGFTQPEYLKAAAQQRVSGWMVKPIDFSKIKKIIEKIVQQEAEDEVISK